MRIGIDARLWNESGVGRYIRNLVSELQKLDKKNEYVLFARDSDCEDIKKKWKMEHCKWKIVVVNIRWHTIEEQLQFPSILNKEKLDLVHFPYFSVPIFYKRPFIVTIHDLILHHFPTGEASTLPLPLYKIKRLGYKFVIGQAAKNAQKIITVSNATKQEIVDHLGVDSKKVVVTYEGVNEQIRNPNIEIRNKSKISNLKFSKIEPEKYFLYVGNAYPHKNLDRLIQSFQSFCHPDPPAGGEGSLDSSSVSRRTQNDIRLVLVGKEDYFYKKLKRKARAMNVEDSVVFYGEASDEKLVYLYQNALALVMPSLMEGFGLPAVEAMANRCLVLASDIPSLKEICQDAAVYFNPYDIDEMVERMKAVHSNDTYYYSGNIKKGFARAKMFSWEKMAKETLQVYKDTGFVY